MFDFIETPHVYDAAGTELFTGAIPELLRESAQGGLTELACSTAASADVFATKLAHGPRNRILLGINAQKNWLAGTGPASAMALSPGSAIGRHSPHGRRRRSDSSLLWPPSLSR
jgi:hypothetical protein